MTGFFTETSCLEISVIFAILKRCCTQITTVNAGRGGNVRSYK